MHEQQDKSNISARIKRGRIALGLTRSELAREIGVSPQAVQQWENGKTAPKGDNLRKLSSQLNYTPQYLQFGETTEDLYELTMHTQLNLERALQSTHFDALYHASVTHMMRIAVESGWITINPEFSPMLLADIGLNHLRWLKSTSRLRELNEQTHNAAFSDSPTVAK